MKTATFILAVLIFFPLVAPAGMAQTYNYETGQYEHERYDTYRQPETPTEIANRQRIRANESSRQNEELMYQMMDNANHRETMRQLQEIEDAIRQQNR